MMMMHITEKVPSAPPNDVATWGEVAVGRE